MPSNKGTQWKTTGAKGVMDAYRLYKKEEDRPVDEKTYRAIIRECNKEFMRLVIEEGKEMRFPYLSTLQICKSQKPKKNNYDYGHYNKTGEKRVHENEHSDGFKGRFHWSKGLKPIVGKSTYRFEPARICKRTMAKQMNIPGGHVKYIERTKRYF